MKEYQEVQHVRQSKSMSANSDSKANQSRVQLGHPMQLMANSSQRIVQLRSMQQLADQKTVQRQVNNTGLPDNLKSGIENLSGYSMNDVKVHYNSDKPAQLNAHAYAQGNQIHLASGQEKHLAHEAWHVVQQKQGRVQPTKQLKGKVAVNDDAGLEKEADIMGAKALQMREKSPAANLESPMNNSEVSQLARDPNLLETSIVNDTLGRSDLSGKAEGFGAMVGGKKWITKVGWGGVDAGAGEGTRMVAQPLGPDHPSGKESGKSGPESKARAQFLTAITGTSYIQGHLLNDKLGGPAEVRNLTAIPGKPGNSAHSSAVEEPIKTAIDNRNWVYYSVAVAYETKKLNQITPIDQNTFNQIKQDDCYKNLPGVKPARLDSDFTIASSFTTEWYTYQADGNRHGPVNKVTIHFPVYINNEVTKYKDNLGRYIDEFVTIGATTDDEKATHGAAATATKASWLGLNKNLINKLNSVSPNTDARNYEDEADLQWQNEYDDLVDEDAETLTYPDRHDNWIMKTVNIPVSPGRRRIRKGNAYIYIRAFDSNEMNDIRIQRSWDLYKIALKDIYRQRYANEWAAVRDANDDTLN
jgi:hypothetical protein